MNGEEYEFRIADGYTPATLPMERLAEYMAALARLLGEGGHVHFHEIKKGSVRLKARVDEPARPKVRERVRAYATAAARETRERHMTPSTTCFGRITPAAHWRKTMARS